MPLDKYRANETIYNVLSVDFNIFYKILSLKAAIYSLSGDMGVLSDDSSGSCGRDSDTILYSASSHAPKSINLHRREQKGKNFASSDFSLDNALTIS